MLEQINSEARYAMEQIRDARNDMASGGPVKLSMLDRLSRAMDALHRIRELSAEPCPFEVEE